MSIDEQVANWPAKSGEYKVLQLEIDGKPYLRFGKANQKIINVESASEFHVRILVSFLEVTGREYPIIKKFGAYVPALESEWYKVHGAGSAEIDVERKLASFFGKSASYEIEIDEQHLDSVGLLLPDWKLRISKEQL